MEITLINRENSKMNTPANLFLTSQRLDLRSPNKHIVLKNLLICYTWKI